MRELSSNNAILINTMPLQKKSTRKTFAEIKKDKLEEFAKTGKIGGLKIRDKKQAIKLATTFAKEKSDATQERNKSKDNKC